DAFNNFKPQNISIEGLLDPDTSIDYLPHFGLSFEGKFSDRTKSSIYENLQS
ncbi:33602_t:CDS:1, partial [Racocetra persica]